jgi:sortase (surface protein transpeptidase)
VGRRAVWLAVSAAAFVLGVGLLVVGLTGDSSSAPPLAPRADGKRVAPSVVRGESPAEAPARARRKLLIDGRAAPPRRIRIPAIGVSAPVVPLGLNPDRSLEVPQKWGNTGWYTGGPEPGERGPAVIAGHVDSTSGPAVFYRLGELDRGNLIHVRRADGSVASFRVQGIERWPKDRFPTRRVYHPTHTSTLRLITCGGAFNRSTGHYLDNTIVYATRIRRDRDRTASRDTAPVQHASIDLGGLLGDENEADENEADEGGPDGGTGQQSFGLSLPVVLLVLVAAAIVVAFRRSRP